MGAQPTLVGSLSPGVVLAGGARGSWEASCVSAGPASLRVPATDAHAAVHDCYHREWEAFLCFVSLNLVCMCMHAKSLQLCPTLCNPLDSSPPGSSVHGILQARILEWVVMPSSRGSSQLGNRTCVSLSPALAGRFFTTSATWEAQVWFGSHFLVQNINASIQKMKINHIHKALN